MPVLNPPAESFVGSHPERVVLLSAADGRRAGGGRRRSMGRIVMLLLLGSALVLSSCSSSVRQPTSYGEVNSKGEGFYGNFMYGCTGVQPTNGKYVDEKLSSSEYCRCLFEGLKNKVPFDEVRDFEEKQAEAKEGHPPTVPKRIEEVRKSCSKRL